MLSFRNRASHAITLLGICLTLCLCASVRAANPKVTLKLENVTAPEAVAALGGASGVTIQFDAKSSTGGKRASFDWSGVPLAQAMRDLTDKLNVVFFRLQSEAGYGAWVNWKPSAPDLSRITAERNGVRVSLDSVTADFDGRESFVGKSSGWASGGLHLEFSVQSPGGDGEAISGISHVTAKDDLGNILIGGGRVFDHNGALLPDEASAGVSLRNYDFRAQKLLWLEGEVDQYRVFRDLVFDYPQPALAFRMVDVPLPQAGASSPPLRAAGPQALPAPAGGKPTGIVPTSVGAGNPRITLKLQNVTAPEAVAALEKASGVPLQFSEHSSSDGKRASFEWSGVPLAQAMRDLYESLHVGFSHVRNRYGYTAWIVRTLRVPVVSAISTERNGVRVSLDTLAVNSQLRENFVGQERQRNSGNVDLEVSVLFPAGDGQTISGTTRLTAKDDLGNTLVGSSRPAFPSPDDRFPDEATARASLTGYDPRAHKLLWVEGEVDQYRVFRDLVLDFPVPLSAGSLHKETGNLGVDIVKLELPEPGVRESANAELRVTTPVGNHPGPGIFFDVSLVGASGRVYGSNGTSIRGEVQGSTDLYAVTCAWPSLPEEITALRVTWREKSDPQPLVSFRLRDVPLPQVAVFLPHLQGAGVHAFFDPAGGTLSGLVKAPGAPNATGDVWYGLSPVTAGAENFPSWREVHLLPDGTGKLEKVKPGRYRVLRIYRGEEWRKLPDAGHWLHAEETVEIKAGEKTTLPPLEWSQEAPPPARPAK